ncbi:FMRFamide receptor [Atheta coriaria]|uniref:FMRFamide receptor n=1 Tax=Dalotia coriaria TaxID=877792 RepID=UPI0031F3584B
METTEIEDPSAGFLDSTRFWVQRVFVPILVIIGVGGNIVTVMILTRRRMRCTTHIYLTALAVADLIYLLFVFVLSFEHYSNIHDGRFVLYWRFYGMTHWLCDAASSTSVWLIVSFTVERYIIVCHPLRGKVYCTESRAKSIITVISLLCLISTASTTFEYQLSVRAHCLEVNNATQTSIVNDTYITPTTEYLDEGDEEIQHDQSSCNGNCPTAANATNSSEVETCLKKTHTIYTEGTDLSKNVTYTTIFYWFSSITFGLLPFVLIAMFNSFLVAAVYRSMRTRKALTNAAENTRQRHENRITILLIGIVVLFLVCQTPTAAFLIYDALDTTAPSKSGENIKRGLGNIFNLLITLNASLNFLMYCVLSANYRSTFRSVFCAKKLHRGDTAFSRYYRERQTSTTGFRRNQSEYQRTPRGLESTSLTSIPRSKSLMTRPLGHAKSTDLVV